MPTYDVREIPSAESGTDNSGKQTNLLASRRFTILLDRPDDGCSAEVVKRLAPMPRIGDPHPDNLGLFCRTKRVRQLAPLYFEADVSYTGIGPEDGSSGDDKNPFSEPVQLKWTTTNDEEPIDQDVQGNPIQTVTGESYDPPLRRPFADLHLTITRRVPTFDALQAWQYMHAVNADTFMRFPPGAALIDQFEASSVTDGKFQYWEKVVGIRFRWGKPKLIDGNGPNVFGGQNTFVVDFSRAWWRRVRAEGFLVLSQAAAAVGGGVAMAAGGQFVRAVDAHGEPTAKPVLHDIATGKQITDPRMAQWYEYEIYRALPFMPLQLI